MWTYETHIHIQASPARIWQLFSDLPGWRRWNSGIAEIELLGPFAEGTCFLMKPPGEDTFSSTLLEVRENAGFTDRTVLGDNCVLVHHRIAPDGEGVRVTYSTEVTGPDADDIGPMVTADFPEVLAALKALAEAP
ncbi:SRPBCC family protein [Gallaecimonas kandeliae]|uniref:SRPBCC family protein n=1 Tax=Gallaecimonas kandeliae TaxID=3029055 RepID=UPI00264A09C0|nr:SRPBCC family protein [Gallaecimonas kandeliae]WKE66894.1 SRPBCC family protein [Gallaecimonas kandeliae]